jgi:FG-GAP-like repeat
MSRTILFCLSFPRKRESSIPQQEAWVPAFAGTTGMASVCLRLLGQSSEERFSKVRCRFSDFIVGRNEKNVMARFKIPRCLYWAIVASLLLTLSLSFQAASPALQTPTAKAAPPAGAKAFPVQLVDITRQAGIRFQHNTGAFGQKYLPETMGSGCAFLDYNNDGWQDILLINGMDWPGHKRRTSFPALYRNNKNGTFLDVTSEAGLATEIYGMGTAIGDYDNDGWVDVYISALGPDRLFKNLGNGKFADVTQKASLLNPDYGASAAWLDYDKDGDLDLVVTHYVHW